MSHNSTENPMILKHRTVGYKILFMFAWKNLMSKKLRSFLTVFGVIIGISAIYFLLTFGLGIQSLVTTQVIGDKSLKAVEVTSPNSKVLALNDDAVNKMREYAHVDKIGLQYSFPGSIKFNGGEIDSVVYGINKDYQDTTTLNLSAGRLLNDDDRRGIVVNESALRSLGIDDRDDAIGKSFDISIPLQKVAADVREIRDTFTVVGVVDSGAGSELFMISDLFSVAGVPVYQQVKIVTDDVTFVGPIRAQVESMGFETLSLTDTLSEINQIFKFFNIILVGFGSVGMIVAILGMFNTLTISLLERTKEIGLMMALGARRADMRKLFMFEAVLISFAGAVAGIVLATIGGKIVDFAINTNARGRGVTETFTLFSYPLLVTLAVILFTICVGLLVVYFPARRAERINPIDALRRE